MGRPLTNLLGQRFGRLVVIERSQSSAGASRWLCTCDCGAEKVVAANSLKSGNTRSCGCLNSEVSSERNKETKRTHGKSHTAMYVVWIGMKRRCSLPNHQAYQYYGAMGVQVCPEWMDFEAFYEWSIANGYKKGLHIDRIDPDGNYDPNNCRWVTPKVNANNRRNGKRRNQCH